jgi:hypothetical protein
VGSECVALDKKREGSRLFASTGSVSSTVKEMCSIRRGSDIDFLQAEIA